MRREYRTWRSRTTAILATAAAAALAMLALQVARFEDAPGLRLASALLVGQIATLLLYILVRHLQRRGLHGAPVVSVLGAVAAAAITVVTPWLKPAPPVALPTELVVRPPFDSAERTPLVPEAAATAQGAAVEPLTPLVLPDPGLEPVRDSAAGEEPPEQAELALYRELREEPLRRHGPPLSGMDDLREVFRLGWPSFREPDVMPPMNISASVFLGKLGGEISLGGSFGEATGSIDSFLGEETFEVATELTAGFPLTSRDLFRVSVIGLRTSEEGELDRDRHLGSALFQKGESYRFDLDWGHLFTGFTHLVTGYTRESQVDFAAHFGVMADHLAAELRIGSADASVEDHERGWAALAAGFTVGFWQSSSGGVSLEVLQSVPLNIGGQTLVLTDLRLVIQQDLSESVSFVVGVRRVFASFVTYDDPVRRQGRSSVADFDAGGPLIGLDIRF